MGVHVIDWLGGCFGVLWRGCMESKEERKKNKIITKKKQKNI